METAGDLTLLKDIAIIFALSVLVNVLFSRLKTPTVVGYLITGIIAGPHVLSIVGSQHDIEFMAEIGVILLLFTIGMEFSLKHLLKIRYIVFWGGLIQVLLSAAIFFFLSRVYGLQWQPAILIGFLTALSSSALVLKILQDRSELTSNYGRTVLGILIFQDLLLVPLLLFTDLLAQSDVNYSTMVLVLLLKAAAIITLVFIGNKFLLPRLLYQIAMTKNQELFMLSIFLICITVALITSSLGMSLAFGAFLSGLMVSESEYSHNAFGNLEPIKNTFTSFFFVSIGMLLDIGFFFENYRLILLSVFLIIFFKTIIAAFTGFVLGHTLRGTILVGFALSQIGEFSFVLVREGYSLAIIDSFYYRLFIAAAVLTMMLTPLLMELSSPFARFLLRFNLPLKLVNGMFPLPEIELPSMSNHVVIIGKDSCALRISDMANDIHLPHVSVVFDPSIVRERVKRGDMTIYGDAVNEPILLKAHTDTADIIVISVGNLIPCMAIIESVRRVNKNALLLVRTRHIRDAGQLYAIGADQVLSEKFEIAMDFFSRVLENKKYQNDEIASIILTMRNKENQNT